MTPISNVKQHGFTLLELMVVLSIIALAVSLTMPNIATSDNSAFNAEIRKALTTLNYARRIAIVQAQPAIAEFRTQTAGSDATTAATDDRNSLWFNAEFTLGFQNEFDQVPQATSAIKVIFFPQGGSTGGTLSFTREERVAMIRVDPITGRIDTAYNGEELADE